MLSWQLPPGEKVRIRIGLMGCLRNKMTTALGVPRRSPIQVLTKLNVA